MPKNNNATSMNVNIKCLSSGLWLCRAAKN